MRKLLVLMMYSCICSVLLMAGVSFAEGTTAGGEQETEGVFRFREIVIKDKKDQPGTVSVLGEKEVKQSTKTDLIGVISENVPSFHTGSNRVMGYGIANSNPAKMSIRGMGVSSWGPTTGFPIFVDGFDTEAHIFSHPMPDVLGMKNIERIEVYHGPQPVLFGSGAMAGAVNVITKRQEVEGYNTVLSGSFGSYNSTDDYVHHRGKMGIMDYAVSYNFKRTDGHREEEINGTEYTSEFVSHNGTARFGVQMGKHFYANVNSYLVNFEMHDPGPTNRKVNASALEVFDVTRGGASLSLHNTFDKFEGFMQVSYNQGNHDITNPVTDEITFQSVDKTYAAKLQETLKLIDGNRLTVGAEYKKYGGDITDDANDSKMEDDYFTDRSLYGMVSQQITRFFALSAGARYTDNNEYGGFSAYQGGVIVTPVKTTKIFANAAKGFNIPGIRYRFNLVGMPGLVSDVNNDLEPETMITYEAGVEQTLFEYLTLGATGYKIYSQNRILLDKAQKKWVNADYDINYKGVELFARFSYKDIAGARIAYSFIDNRYSVGGVENMLAFVPRHKTVFGIFGTFYNVYVGLNGEYVRTVYQDYPTLELDNYFLLNAKIAYTFLGRYQVFANFNNITDENYTTFLRQNSDYSGYGEYDVPGFNMLAGITVEF